MARPCASGRTQTSGRKRTDGLAAAHPLGMLGQFTLRYQGPLACAEGEQADAPQLPTHAADARIARSWFGLSDLDLRTSADGGMHDPVGQQVALIQRVQGIYIWFVAWNTGIAVKRARCCRSTTHAWAAVWVFLYYKDRIYASTSLGREEGTWYVGSRHVFLQGTGDAWDLKDVLRWMDGWSRRWCCACRHAVYETPHANWNSESW